MGDVDELVNELYKTFGSSFIKKTRGTVISVESNSVTCKISNGDTYVPEIKCLDGYYPQIGDEVQIIVDGSDLVIFGHISPFVGRPSVRLTNSTVQTIGAASNINLAWDTLPEGDPYDMFDVSDPTKVTIRAPGPYWITTMVDFDPGTVANGERQSYIVKNATSSTGVIRGWDRGDGVYAGGRVSCHSSFPSLCVVGDFFQIVALSTSTGTVPINVFNTWLLVERR